MLTAPTMHHRDILFAREEIQFKRYKENTTIYSGGLFIERSFNEPDAVKNGRLQPSISKRGD